MQFSCIYSKVLPLSPGDCKREFNPTNYRSQGQYSHLVTSAHWTQTEGGQKFGFDIILTKKVQTYVKV